MKPVKEARFRPLLVIISLLLAAGIWWFVFWVPSDSPGALAGTKFSDGGSEPHRKRRVPGSSSERRAALLATDFSSLSSRAEKDESLRTRLEGLKLSESGDQLEENIQALWDDLKSLNSFERLPYTLALEESLALIDVKTKDPLSWFATHLPLLERVLQGKRTPFGDSLSQVFSSLVSNLRTNGNDIVQELEKVDNKSRRSELAVLMVPHLYLVNGDRQFELLKTLEPDQKAEAEEALMEISVSENAHHIPSLELYLEGGGGKGAHEKLVGRLFERTDWVWDQSQKLEELLNSTNPGSRKDLVVAELVEVISKTNPKEAEAWLPEISDATLRESVKLSLHLE